MDATIPDDAANGGTHAGFTVGGGPPAENDDETIARLAKLPTLEYERVRTIEAEQIGCRTAILDRLVGQAQGRAGCRRNASGRTTGTRAVA